MYIVWTGQVHCSLQIVLSNTYVISRIGFQVLFLFRYYFVKYLLLKFSSICFNSPVSISHFFLFVFSVAFFSGCFPQHCIDIVLFLHCSYSLEIWFAHITVLSSILCHFGNLCCFPKDPSLFTVSYFPLVLSVSRCEQCLRYDCLFLSQVSSITGLPCGYASVLSFNAHTSWLHMPSRVRHTTLFSYLPGTYFWCNWLLICQIHVCHWGLCIECLWLSLAFVFLAIVYCNSHFAVSAML